MRGDTTRRARSHGSVSPLTAGLVGSSGFAAIPTTTLDLLLVQRLRRSPRPRGSASARWILSLKRLT